MNREKRKKFRKYSRWLEGIFGKNPVLLLGLALPFAVMGTDSLKNAVSLSILLACSLIPSVLLASLVGRFLPKWAALPLYAVVSMVLVLSCAPLLQLFAPESSGALGIYIPILSVNTLMFTLCGRYSSEKQPGMALVDALSYSLGFALAMALIACVREWSGSGTLWGYALPTPLRLRGMQYVFAGFLAAGLFSALFQFCRRGIRALIFRRDNRSPSAENPNPQLGR